MKVIYKSGSQIDINFVDEFLKSNGFNTLVKYQGAGSYLNITTGYPTGEIQLLVDDDKVEEAQQLLKKIEPNKSTESKEPIKKSSGVQVLAWIMLVVIVIVILLVIFQSI